MLPEKISKLSGSEMLFYTFLLEMFPKKRNQFWKSPHCSAEVTENVHHTPGGGGDSHMEQTGMLVGNFEFNP